MHASLFHLRRAPQLLKVQGQSQRVVVEPDAHVAEDRAPLDAALRSLCGGGEGDVRIRAEQQTVT